jgi:four helix bundle protein
MTSDELKARTKSFTLRVMRLIAALPRSAQGRTISQQLMDSASSVGANYRSSCRARSKKEFVAKLGVVVEEADESAFWLELVVESEMLPAARVQPLLDEANEITAIMTASYQTARKRLQQKTRQP